MPLAGGTKIPACRPRACPTTSSSRSRPGAALLPTPPSTRPARPPGSPTTANSAIDWSTVRGAFLLNGTLYYGLTAGRFYKRTFNTATGAIGAQRP